MGSQRKSETHEEFLERNRREARERYANDPEWRAYHRSFDLRRRSDDRREAYLTKAREGNRRRLADPIYRAKVRLAGQARLHGITPEYLTELRAGGCGICGVIQEPNGKALHVDHDHTCCPRGKKKNCGTCIRGVLCNAHNLSFELYFDSPRVIAYLKRTPAGRATLTRIGSLAGRSKPPDSQLKLLA